jgi:proline dehydrogenase
MSKSNLSDGKEQFELAYQSLWSAINYLERLNPAMEKAAELFRMGDEKKANEHYAQCIEGLQWFIHMVEGAKQLLQVSYKEPENLVSQLPPLTSKLNVIVDEMFSAQTDKDWIMLADLLEYELVPLLKRWEEFFPSLQTFSNQHITSQGN